jgi:hypothetical protein
VSGEVLDQESELEKGVESGEGMAGKMAQG